MVQQKQLQKLFDKPMNRREFLAHIGAGAMIVLGISGLLKSLLELGHRPKAHVIQGFGSSPYGGGKK